MASALKQCLTFWTRRGSLQMRRTSCLALRVIGRHLEMKGATCWTSHKQEQLHIWAAWRQECWGGEAWQELCWWEYPALLANAWFKSKCLLCSWWHLLPSPAVLHTAVFYQSRGSVVLFGTVIQRLKVTRTVQPHKGYSWKCLWPATARLDSAIVKPQCKMWVGGFFCILLQ